MWPFKAKEKPIDWPRMSMIVAQSRAWDMLFFAMTIPTRVSYNKQDIFGMMQDALRRATDSLFMEEMDRAIGAAPDELREKMEDLKGKIVREFGEAGEDKPPAESSSDKEQVSGEVGEPVTQEQRPDEAPSKRAITYDNLAVP